MAAIIEPVVGFEAWLKVALGACNVVREVPLLALNANDSVVSGAGDVLARSDKGCRIIDCKSDETHDYDARFRRYFPQLLACANAPRQSESVQSDCGIAIFWIITGGLRDAPSGVTI